MNEDFNSISEKVAAKFLQTVVFVDDRANYRSETPPPTKINSPRSLNLDLGIAQDKVSLVPKEQTISDTGAIKPENIDSISHQSTLSQPSESGDGNEIITTITTSDKWHELNAQDLIYAFSNEGLVCSVLRPSQDELDGLSKTVTLVARNADLLVLDWVLYGQRGDLTIQIIKDLIDLDKQYDERLRLIVVYTGENDLRFIAKRISENVGAQIINDDTLCSMQLNNCRITVYAKEGVGVASDLVNRKIAVEYLPKTLLSEFSQLTSGLVSNLALDSLATLRSNTYALLSKLNSDVDIPFLTHRVLLPRPDDSAEHLVDIVVSEIRFLLDEFEVAKNASFPNIEKWLEAKNISDYVLTCVESENSLTQAQILAVLEKGSSQLDVYVQRRLFSSSKKKEIYKYFTQLLCQDEDKTKSEKLDIEFAMLTVLGKSYLDVRKQEPRQKLTLGAILEEVKDGAANALAQDNNGETLSKYWLCIQPRCDSARIKELERAFPFLPLELVDGTGKFDLIVKNSSGNSVKLKLSNNSYDLKMEIFSVNSSDDESVIANWETSKEGKYLVFISTNNIKYRWLADLKREHSQGIVNSFSSQLARVGLNQSEWLSRWS
jgi:hypothetical protein